MWRLSNCLLPHFYISTVWKQTIINQSARIIGATTGYNDGKVLTLDGGYRGLTSSSSDANHCNQWQSRAFHSSSLKIRGNRFCSDRLYNKSNPRSFTTEIVQTFPDSMQPYLRLIRFDRPIGTYLLYLPCTWSIAMASAPGHIPDLKLLALFGLGAVIMRGSGCIINDMWDSDFDKKVFRTRDRPIASGLITYKQALIFLATQMTLGLAVLLSLNQYSIILGACSIPFVVSYPLMKRFTYWPQLFLGITFNWGALLGYAAVRGYCDWNVVIPLYTAGISWTLFYDTIYAHQDKDDDRLISVKSTALLFGDNTKYWLSLFGGITTASLLLSGLSAHQSWPYYAALGGGIFHLMYQIYNVNLSDPSNCLKMFKSNMWYGLLVFCGVVGGTLLADAGNQDRSEEMTKADLKD